MTRAVEVLVVGMATILLCGISFQVGLTWCKQSPIAASELAASAFYHSSLTEVPPQAETSKLGVVPKPESTHGGDQPPMPRQTPPQEATNRPAAGAGATATATATAASAEGTTGRKLVVYGNCQGNNNAHIPDPTHFGVLALKAAFPERDIVVNQLTQRCLPIEGETKYPHTDVIIVAGWGYDDMYKDAVTKPDRTDILPSPTDKSTNDLMMYNGAKIVRHHSNRTFMIAIHNEAHGGRGGLFDLMIESKSDVHHAHGICSAIFWPMAARWIYQNRWYQRTVQDLIVKPDFNADAVLAAKTRFCVFRHKQCDKKFYSKHAGTRVALLDAISNEYKKVDSLGLCRGDRSARDKYNIEPTERHKLHYTDSSVDTFAQYKFSFAMENNFVDGYWTEKMINGIFSNTVPIMGGFKPPAESTMAEYINMDRVIYCQFDIQTYEHDKAFPGFNSADPNGRIQFIAKAQAKELSACVQQIKSVDEDDDLWKKKVATPFLKGNRVGEDSVFGLRRVGASLRQSFIDHDSYLIK